MSAYNSEPITSIDKLNEKKDRCIYIAIVGDYMMCDTVKADMDKYLASDESMVSPLLDVNDTTLLYGLVLDIEKLPYQIPEKVMKDKCLWLLCDKSGEVSYELHTTMAEVTEAIEYYLQKDNDVDITDFAVILGEELELSLSVSKSGSYINVKDAYGDD